MERLSINDNHVGPQHGNALQGSSNNPQGVMGPPLGPSMPPQGPPQLPPQMFTTAAQLLDLTDSQFFIYIYIYIYTPLYPLPWQIFQESLLSICFLCIVPFRKDLECP